MDSSPKKGKKRSLDDEPKAAKRRKFPHDSVQKRILPTDPKTSLTSVCKTIFSTVHEMIFPSVLKVNTKNLPSVPKKNLPVLNRQNAPVAQKIKSANSPNKKRIAVPNRGKNSPSNGRTNLQPVQKANGRKCSAGERMKRLRESLQQARNKVANVVSSYMSKGKNEDKTSNNETTETPRKNIKNTTFTGSKNNDSNTSLSLPKNSQQSPKTIKNENFEFFTNASLIRKYSGIVKNNKTPQQKRLESIKKTNTSISPTKNLKAETFVTHINVDTKENNETVAATEATVKRVLTDNFQQSAMQSVCTMQSQQSESTFGTEHFTNVTIPSSTIEIEDVDMEWSPSFAEETETNSGNLNQSMSDNKPEKPKENVTENNNLYIIVDTCVFMNSLNVLKTIFHISFEDDTYPVLYVPWMVVQELDYFKDGYCRKEKNDTSKQVKSRLAIKFINECLLSKKDRIKYQTVDSASENNVPNANPDDSILSCCFQVAKKYKMILLTNDINLRNKVLIHDLAAYPPDEIIRILGQKKQKIKRDLLGTTKEQLSFLCSYIIVKESRGIGVNTNEMPWSLMKCIEYFRSHYDSMFRNQLQKQSRKVIDDIYEHLFVNDDNDDKLRQLAMSLLIYLRHGLPMYASNIKAAIEKIKRHENDGIS